MVETDEIQSDFLFARPSFIEGVARLADLSGSLNAYNQSRTPQHADGWAIFRDWRAVGRDLLAALEELRREAGPVAR